MTKKENISALTEEGFRFFGTMSASTTHEIKNTLAIINENIGLLDDLSMMAQDGILSTDQISGISQNIKKQVQRSNNILKKFNTFSHSTDISDKVIDLEETVRLTVDIASRLISNYKVTIEIIPAASHLNVRGNQFFLENMFWKAIESACRGTGEQKKVVIEFKQHKETREVWFSIGDIKTGFLDTLFSSAEVRVLINHLDIDVKKNSNRFGLIWSETI